MLDQIRARLIRAAGAHVFGQAAQVVIQLASVPLFLAFWHAPLYGEWLILMAVPAYLAFSDLGFGTAAANDMAILVGRGDRDGALRVFQSISFLFLALAGLLATLTAIAVWTLPLREWLNLSILGPQETALVALLAALYTLVSLQGSLPAAGLRCVGHYALAKFYMDLARLFEFSVVALALVLGAAPVAAASALLAARVAGMAALYAGMKRKAPWIALGHRHANRGEVKRLAPAAFSFLALPVGNALNSQGVVLAVGAALGPQAVVVFATLRTLSRFVLRLIDMVGQSIWPEISLTYGAADLRLARMFHARSSQVALWLAAGAVAVLSMAGGYVLEVWTYGKVAMNWPLFHLLLVMLMFAAIWKTSFTAIAATNRHGRFALFFLAVQGLAVPAVYAAAQLDLAAAGIPLLIAEAALAVCASWLALRQLEDTPGDFLGQVIRPPLFVLRELRALRRAPTERTHPG